MHFMCPMCVCVCVCVFFVEIIPKPHHPACGYLRKSSQEVCYLITRVTLSHVCYTVGWSVKSAGRSVDRSCREKPVELDIILKLSICRVEGILPSVPMAPPRVFFYADTNERYLARCIEFEILPGTWYGSVVFGCRYCVD